MQKQEFLKILSDELNAETEDLLSSKETEVEYHIKKIILYCLDKNFYDYSQMEIKSILQYEKPLDRIYKSFKDSQDISSVFGEATEILIEQCKIIENYIDENDDNYED